MQCIYLDTQRGTPKVNRSASEQILSGSPENDFPVGDYVCLCLKCYHDFHGQRENKICYQCVMDNNTSLRNDDANNCTMAVFIGMFIGTVLGFLIGSN